MLGKKDHACVRESYSSAVFRPSPAMAAMKEPGTNAQSICRQGQTIVKKERGKKESVQKSRQQEKVKEIWVD